MPGPVDKYFKEIKQENPSYSDEQAWATAWSIYCKHKNPGSEHCHKDSGDYLNGKSAMTTTTATDTTKEEWTKALKEDEANLSKMEKALKLLESGKQAPGDPHWSIGTAKKVIEGLKEVIHNKKQLITKLAVIARSKVAKEWPSEESLKKYLHEHPQADPGAHWVKEDEHGEEKVVFHEKRKIKPNKELGKKMVDAWQGKHQSPVIKAIGEKMMKGEDVDQKRLETAIEHLGWHADQYAEGKSEDKKKYRALRDELKKHLKDSKPEKPAKKEAAERVVARFQRVAYPMNHLDQFPTGLWGYIGRVDVRLKYVNRHGEELSQEEAEMAASANMPALMGFKTRVWKTALEALQAAKKLHQQVTVSSTDMARPEIAEAVKHSGVHAAVH